MAERGPAARGDEFSGATAPSGSDSATSSDAAPALTEQVQEVAGQVQEQAGQLVDQVRGQLTTQLTSQKDRAAEGLETAAGLLRGAGEQLRALDQPTVAQYVDQASGRVEQWSETLRTQDIGQLAETVEQFARRRPALFAGGALAAGYLASRFFLSSPPRQQSTGSGSSQPPTGATPYGADIYASGYAGTTQDASLGYGGYGAASDIGSLSGNGGMMDDTGLSEMPSTPTAYPPGSEGR